MKEAAILMRSKVTRSFPSPVASSFEARKNKVLYFLLRIVPFTHWTCCVTESRRSENNTIIIITVVLLLVVLLILLLLIIIIIQLAA